MPDQRDKPGSDFERDDKLRDAADEEAVENQGKDTPVRSEPVPGAKPGGDQAK